jgi:hypothetical protein
VHGPEGRKGFTEDLGLKRDRTGGVRIPLGGMRTLNRLYVLTHNSYVLTSTLETPMSARVCFEFREARGLRDSARWPLVFPDGYGDELTSIIAAAHELFSDTTGHA